MADSNELVVFMTLPRGVEEAIIPGVLASRNVPFVLVDRYLARQGQYVEVQVPSSRLKDARQALADAKKVGKVFSVAEKTTYQVRFDSKSPRLAASWRLWEAMEIFEVSYFSASRTLDA